MIDEEEEKLIAKLRTRNEIRKDRAIRRAFFTCGLLGSVPLLVVFAVQMLRNVGLIPAVYATLVALPFGCLLFGTGPAIFAMVWMSFFPESRLGDKSLRRR